jgi:hypothetical protein
MDVSDSQTKQRRRTLTRSPNYPAIDLGRAIERARALYKSERQHPMSALQAVRHWGYSSLNSPGGGQLAALTRFGLLEDEGSRDERTVRVTDLAVKILEHPDANERQAAVRQAALLPSVHQDMWQRYGLDLPSEDNLRWFLTRDRGFSENGAKDFIREYRATVEFAQLEPDEDGEDLSQKPAVRETATPSSPGHGTSQGSSSSGSDREYGRQEMGTSTPPITFPLASGKTVSVSGLVDLTEADWTQFIAVLNALKPSLVKGSTEPQA